MVTKKIDKYAGYRYEIVTPEELREANWLIEQGDFKDMEAYIDFATKVEIKMVKKAEAEKKRKTIQRKQRREARKTDKAA